MKIISLGWGVQSFTLAAMSALGELPKVDYAIHADTTHESQLTYEFARKWAPWLEEHGVKVVTVKPKQSDPTNNGYGTQDVPFYTLNQLGERGQGKRQCTTQWKINPMRKFISSVAGKKTPGAIEQWIGISLDEFQRMKDNDVKYIVNHWPLVDLKMTRADCKAWLQKNSLEIPPRSACTFCPFHNTEEWRRIKTIDNDWNEAVSIDKAIRKAKPFLDAFVHPARKPLEEVDFRTAEEKGQLSLWDNECTGMCGI
jgi:3'-phosphoadenosine 5'-phosphosulfate sulfotransferase (PAPS reductase)/FAD synthetase